jgi:mannitol 2-dehydrogenase
MCYFGYLAGYRYAHEVAQDPLFAQFLIDYMDKEATPTLQPVPGIDLESYKRTLIERFSNEHVRDTLARLCAESSDRIPKWLLPVIRINLEHGGGIGRSAAIVASWARYAEGLDEQGNPIDVVDRLKEPLMAAAARQRREPLAFIANREIFGDLAGNEQFVTAYTRALDDLHGSGARAALESLASRS